MRLLGNFGKLKNQLTILILALLIMLSSLSIFINTGFIKEFTKLELGTTQFLSENIRKIDDLSISQYYQCPDSAQICSDGAGGVFITWDDNRGGGCDIYAQRVNTTGDVQWADNGIAICKAIKGQNQPQISSDGAGSAIITWLDNREGEDLFDWEIYAQRVNSTGDVQWMTNGIPICTVSGSKMDVQICHDSMGGAIITWVDYRSVNGGIYAQSITSTGDIQWITNGVPIYTASGYKGTIQICSDGVDGAIITWQDERSGNRDIYAQRINSTGDILWTTNGVAICLANDYQGFPQICSDGSNGAIITWRDMRSGPTHIYAQRINSTGIVQWTANGTVISIASDVQTDQQICSDGFNGAFIIWHTWVIGDYGESDIYAQRINSSGKVQWEVNGLAICAADGGQIEPQICSGGAGNAIITWLDRRDGVDYDDLDIYAQLIDSTGTTQWMTNGIPVCTASGSKSDPQICSDETNGAIILWQAEKFTKPSIYVQRINSTGDVQWLANGVVISTHGEGIPGYNLIFLLGILSIVTIISLHILLCSKVKRKELSDDLL